VLGCHREGGSALGAPSIPIIDELTKRMGLSTDAATTLFALEMAWWDFRLQTIPYPRELPDVERSFFDVFIRNMYGSPGIGAFVYDNYLKTVGHPDAVRYVADLLAEAAPRSTTKT